MKLANNKNMASLTGNNINLNKIPKEKIYEGKKGKVHQVTVVQNNKKTFSFFLKMITIITKNIRETETPYFKDILFILKRIKDGTS